MKGFPRMRRKLGELLNAQQLELAEYYTSIRHQHSMIFCVGIVCIFCGFAIIGVALLFIASLAGVTPFAFMDSWVTEKGSSVLSEQIILGALGAISGILTNYIAIIYLGVYSKAVESLNRFHGRLVMTYQLHFSNFLASKIENKDIQEKTLADLAIALVNHYQAPDDVSTTEKSKNE